MATYRVQYVDGYGHALGGDHETVDAEGFGLDGDGDWVDFYDAAEAVILRVRAEHVVRIQLVPPAASTPSDFDPLDEELAG
jgi:hypothetical protein